MAIMQLIISYDHRQDAVGLTQTLQVSHPATEPIQECMCVYRKQCHCPLSISPLHNIK